MYIRRRNTREKEKVAKLSFYIFVSLHNSKTLELLVLKPHNNIQQRLITIKKS